MYLSGKRFLMLSTFRHFTLAGGTLQRRASANTPTFDCSFDSSLVGYMESNRRRASDLFNA